MRSYPIWIDVDACIYKSSKSYGARNTNNQNIYVGTSASNSKHFTNINVLRTKNTNGETEFILVVDGKEIKRYNLDKNEIIFNALHPKNEGKKLYYE